MIKSNNIIFYITVIIIWIILFLGIFYLSTTIYTNMYWDSQIKKVYEQFNVLQNYWSPTTGPLDRSKDLYFECALNENHDRQAGSNPKVTFGCKWGKV